MKQKKTGILASVAMSFFICAMGAIAAGIDGVPLSTNDWFDANFTALTADTPIVQGEALGITRGAGSWTAVPATGTAVIAADADAGGGATMLSLAAPDEELTFTPAALAVTSGIETVSAEIKADAIDELPEIDADVQAAFTVYLDENNALSAQGWTAAGWTNLASAAAGSLTNAWFTLYLDFAKEGGVRYVRYSVKPAAGALSVLADAGGTTWFQAGRNADVVSSVSFSGIGSVRAFSGDELEVLGVATYNGVPYQTVEDALAAGLADNWANGNVVLVDDVTWRPTVRGAKYLIDRNGHALDIVDANVSISANDITNTVNGLTYYWIGGGTGSWTGTANWSLYDGGESAGAYPNSYVNNKSVYAYDSVVFTSNATVSVDDERYAVSMTAADGATVTFAGGGSVKTAYNNNSGRFQLLGAGTFRMNGVKFVLPYATSWKDAATIETPIVVAGTSNTIYLATGAAGRYSQLTLSTAIGGSGELKFETGSFSQSKLYLGSADFSGFTGTMAIHVQTPTLPVQGGGTYVIGSSSVAGGLSTVTFSGAGGTLAFADGVDGDVSAAIKNSTAAITVDTGVEDFAWATALAASNVGGLVKKGTGTLTLSAVPLYGGETVVSEGTLVIPGGSTVAKLTIDEDADAAVAGEEGETVTISEFGAGTSTSDITAVPGVVLSWDGNTATISRESVTYTWTGDKDTSWTVAGNWSVGGVASISIPSERDKVVFPSSEEPEFAGWIVNLASAQTVTNVTAEGAVTLSGALVYTRKVEGSATITLGDNAGFGTYRYKGAQLDISADLKAVGSEANKNQLHGWYSTKGGKPDEGGTQISFSGSLSGDGYLQIVGCRSTDTMSGDWSEFAGTVEVWSDQVSRHNAKLTANCHGSSNAVWKVWNSAQDAFVNASGTTCFGALFGTVYQAKNSYNKTFEIGALNIDCGFNGQIGASDYNHIRKVGTATLTFAGSKLGNLEVRDGVFAVGAESAMPNTSITFTGSGFFDPTTNTVDFASKLVNSTTAPIGLLITNDVAIGAISASNTQGLVKTGEGTLTLTALPLYTGVTYLDGGALRVPLTWRRKVRTHAAGKHTESTVDGDYKVYTIVDGEAPAPTVMFLK